MIARMEGEPALREQYGPWTVSWRPTGFTLRCPRRAGNGFFIFSRILLPIDIAIVPGQQTGHAVLKLDPFNLVEILNGAARPDLVRFKRRVSGEVLAAVKKSSPFGCSDCAAEAGMIGVSWDGSVCPGCREFYCRNARCLRRLRLVVLRSGFAVCAFCGSRNEPSAALPHRRPLKSAPAR